MRKLRFAVPALLASLCMSAAVRAQTLADRVPPDAIAYVGWAGTDTIGPAYNTSHLKSLLTTLNLPHFFEQYLQDQMQRQADQEKAAAARTLEELLGTLARSPTAFYFQSLDMANPQGPVPHMALFSKVGAETAASLAQKLTGLVKQPERADAPPHGAVAVGEYLLIYVGDHGMEPRLKGAAPAESLATTEAFKKSAAELGPGMASPVVSVYADVQGGLRLLQNVLETSPQLKTGSWAQMAPVALEASGLNNLRQAAWAGNFDGPNWQSAAFVGMGPRRSGLLSFFDHKPLSADSMKLIPASATSAGIVRFDGERFLSEISDAAAHINERAPQQVEMVFQQFFAFTGVDVKKELLPSLGDEFVFYGAPQAAGNSMRGFTVVNHLKDPKKAESAFTAAESFVNLLILQRDPNSKAQFRTENLPAPLDKVTAHVMPLEQAQPAWAIDGGNFYFSLSVAGLQGAIEAANAGATGAKPTLLDNPKFAALRKTLGRQEISTFAFADLVASDPESYEILNRALTRAQAENPAMTHPYTLPPLDRITPDLGSTLKIGWSDAEGFHTREAGPIPGAGFLSPTQFLFMRLGELAGAQARGNAQRAPAAGGGVGGLP